MRPRSTLATLVIAVTFALISSGSAGAYEEVAVTDGGTITGIVKLAGPAPKAETIEVTKDQEACGKTAPSEALVVNAQSKGLKNAVVFLDKVDKGKKLGKAPVLDNTKCLFVPHVVAMPAGTSLDVKNSDPILHNTHAYLGTRTIFNLALPTQNQVIKKKIIQNGVIRVQCDAHTHMSAWVLAVDHPYFAVTDDNGAFKLDGVPPGKYTLAVWHAPWKTKGKDKGGRVLYEPEEGHKLTQEVSVPAKGDVKVSFELK
jgi:hypothetical protein